MKNSSFALTVLLVVVNVLLFLYFIQDQSKRLTTFGSALREELLSEVRKTQAAVIPAEAAQRISNQLDYLQLRQTAILDETRNSIERQSTVFTTVARFLACLRYFSGTDNY